MSAVSIYNLVRALSKPYSNAFFYCKNKRNKKKRKIKVFKAKIISKKNSSTINNFEPGKILKKSRLFFDVKCGEGVIRIFFISNGDFYKTIKYL